MIATPGLPREPIEEKSCASCNHLYTRIATLEAELAEAKTHRANAMDEMEQLAADNAEIEAERDEYKAEWGRCAQDKVAMLEAYQKLQTERDTLRGALERIRNGLGRTRDELSADIKLSLIHI